MKGIKFIMKDKIIELNNNKNYYVVEEIEYNNKKYILCSKTDIKDEKIDTKNLCVCELDLIDDKIAVKDIENEEEAIIISKMLVDKLQKENK